MSDFNLDNAIPVTQDNGKDVRSAPFSLQNAVPLQPADKDLEGQQVMNKFEDIGIQALKGVNVAAQVIRWPFARFIEHPVSTIATALQEPEGKTVLDGTAVGADPHPEHIGKFGTIIGEDQVGGGYTTPRIKLDDGTILTGAECWWEPVAM